MSLNASFAGRPTQRRRSKLDGPEWMLDVLVGIVIIVVEVLVGFLAVSSLYVAGTEIVADCSPSSCEAANIGLSIALFGGAIAVGVTTLIYLVRISTARRSWVAPLWGFILMAIAIVIGYVVMGAGS